MRRSLLWPEAAIWALLSLLLMTTFGLAFVPLGWGNPVVALLIATIKAGLVIVFFMKLGRAPALLRLTACVGLFWMAISFTLTFSDFLTR